MPRFAGIVLLGPPGSGKSHLGRLLAAKGAVRYVEFEPMLIQKFGTGAAFARKKDEALQFLKFSYFKLLQDGGLPLAIESTGFSERHIIVEIARTWPLGIVALGTSKATCVGRITARPSGENLNNSTSEAALFFDFWHQTVLPMYVPNLSVSGVDEREDAEAIERLISA